MIIIYVYQLIVLQAKRSLPKSSFVCFLSSLEGHAPLITYSSADDSLSVKVFVDFFCSPEAAHRVDKTEPRTFSF